MSNARNRFFSFILVLSAGALPGCLTTSLSDGGAKVAVSRNPAPAGCAPAGYVTGEGGGTFGGEYISNDDLIEYAMNDLRNKAADLGANFIQQDPPQLGSGRGTTTTVTITGTAYRCPVRAPSAESGQSAAR
jgi:hypothetical protein